MVRHPEDAVRGARLPDHPGPPPLTQITFLTCRAHYPGGPDRCVMVIQLARSRAGFFPIRSAFPAHAPGRRPHCSFRGLLELHTHYGLPGCSPTYRGLCHEVSASPVSRARRSIAIESNHQLFEWVLPPLVICPFGAHARVPAPRRLGGVRIAGEHSRVRDVKVDGREAPIRAATVRERIPATESANAPSRSRLCLAVWCTPGFLRLAGIWANRLTFMSRTQFGSD